MDRQDRLVSEIMRCEVATLAPDEKLDLAEDIMRLGRVRHMPVTEDSTLVGIVSARDLLAASLSQILEFDWPQRRTFLRSVTVSEVMTAEPVTAQPETTLRAAAKLMLERKCEGGDLTAGACRRITRIGVFSPERLHQSGGERFDACHRQFLQPLFGKLRVEHEGLKLGA